MPKKFSPRMRGCSHYTPGRPGPIEVFPAYAGMFLPATLEDMSLDGFPRVCGDVPVTHRLDTCRHQFSPRMRGCSWWSGHIANDSEVFPAYAGMFRKAHQRWWGRVSFPRVCGDVPDGLDF